MVESGAEWREAKRQDEAARYGIRGGRARAPLDRALFPRSPSGHLFAAVTAADFASPT